MTRAVVHARGVSPSPARFRGQAVARPVPDAFEGRDIPAFRGGSRAPDRGIGLAPPGVVSRQAGSESRSRKSLPATLILWGGLYGSTACQHEVRSMLRDAACDQELALVAG